MSLSFPSIWVPGSSFILASCLIGKEAISSILLDQWVILSETNSTEMNITIFIFLFVHAYRSDVFLFPAI